MKESPLTLATADEDAARILDLVLADGIISADEIVQLRAARRNVAHSQALDARLAGGAA